MSQLLGLHLSTWSGAKGQTQASLASDSNFSFAEMFPGGRGGSPLAPFRIFLFIIGFQQLDNDALWCGFTFFFPAWNFLRVLDLGVYSFHRANSSPSAALYVVTRINVSLLVSMVPLNLYPGRQHRVKACIPHVAHPWTSGSPEHHPVWPGDPDLGSLKCQGPSSSSISFSPCIEPQAWLVENCQQWPLKHLFGGALTPRKFWF